MSESEKHIELVNRIKSYVYDFVPLEFHPLVYVDTAEAPANPVVGHFMPDVYFKYQGTYVLGEAKTESDLLRKHSIEQFFAYLADCERYEGAAYLIVGVPWTSTATIKNFFRRNKNLWQRTSVIILDDAGRSWVL